MTAWLALQAIRYFIIRKNGWHFCNDYTLQMAEFC